MFVPFARNGSEFVWADESNFSAEGLVEHLDYHELSPPFLLLPVAISQALHVLLFNRCESVPSVPHIAGFAGKVAATRLIGGTTAEPLWVDGFAEVLRIEFHEGI